MKRLIVLLSIFCLLVTGCSIKKLDDTNIGENIRLLLSEKKNLYNVYFDGYKYYVPYGMKFVNKEEYNALLTDKMGNKYYMYVDAISYYHKEKVKYEIDDDAHYSNKINYNNKSGYIQVNEFKDKYFIQYMYNYAKIEAFVNKSDLTTAVNNISYILRSIKYNRKVLESLIGENVLDYKEENYNLFEANSSNENFLDVVEKYEPDYKKDLEDEKIDLDD